LNPGSAGGATATLRARSWPMESRLCVSATCPGPDQALSNPRTGVFAIFANRLLNGRPPL